MRHCLIPHFRSSWALKVSIGLAGWRENAKELKEALLDGLLVWHVVRCDFRLATAGAESW